MSVNLKSTEALQLEFDDVRIQMDSYHERMQFFHEAYTDNVYYSQKPNTPLRERHGVNLLSAFSDKNIFYLSEFPKTNVPADPENREASSLVEKIIHSIHEKNDLENKWSDYAFDVTNFSCAVQVTDVDYKLRRVRYERIDPRRAYWTTSDAQGSEIEVFWSAVPMRQSAIKRKYGVDVSGTNAQGLDYWKEYDQVGFKNMTDDPYHLVIRRVDHETIVMWCGDKFVMEGHKHMLPCMPVDVAIPLRIGEIDYKGDFFLRRLIKLQCEFNEAWSQRANIVRRLGNPAVWGRNINNNQLNDVKEGLSMDGGFIGLKENGELGILTIPETKMIDTHLIEIYTRMQDLAGFPPAAFGSVAGANTSADALGMYYQPTTRQINHQNKVMKRFLVSINKKSLMLMKSLLKPGETAPLEGSLTEYKKFARGGMLYNNPAMNADTYTSDDITTTKTVVTTGSVTPKDDINYKRLMYEMARDGVLSKTTMLDEVGFLSPQDELDLLEAETSNPGLNPDGASKMMAANAQQTSADASLLNMGQPGAQQQPSLTE